MGRDGTALLPSLCATVLLRIYPAEAESEIKNDFHVLSLHHLSPAKSAGRRNRSTGYWVFQQQALLPRAWSITLECNAAGWLGGKDSTDLQPGCSHRSNSQACAATCPFPESQVVTEKGKNIVPGRHGARLPADGLTPSPMALHHPHSAEE